MMRLLWAMQYRFCRWLRCRTRRPQSVADYLLAFPEQRREAKELLKHMNLAFMPYKAELQMRVDPECGGVELQATALIPVSMSFEEAEQRLDLVYNWQFSLSDFHIRGGYEWVDE